MNNKQTKDLCISLMHADSEKEVITLLEKENLWDNDFQWRHYGDNENNYSTIGNQQSSPDAALVEKLINSVDARLMNQCLAQGIDLEGKSAPTTIQKAVALFFDKDCNPGSAHAGRVREWTDTKRTEIARGITFIATGKTAREGSLCFTISDCGEGQTPQRMPETFLSLNKSNKLRIPFVQGKFNMGGTGVLNFCGRNGLQLILSRRNPLILNGNLSHSSDSQWGFTIVRREDPQGGRRSSVYTYLAPVDAEKGNSKGGVLHFISDSMPIFPNGRNAYDKESEWGTLIKLYEYSVTGFKSHMLRKGGILGRLDLLLPDVAIPIRLHECRHGYRGHEGSFENTLTGLSVRLDDDKASNLEDGFPTSSPLSAMGQHMTATIFAFKKGKSKTYRNNEGIIFTVNGQTHGHLTADFFRREKKVGLSYLRDSILVIIDCSSFNGRAREDLFMNSRDRLSEGDLRIEIERGLEELLKHHDGLRILKERRRREEIESKLDDSKPLEEILESLLKHSPTLFSLFLKGNRVSNPFKSKKAKSEDKKFEGKKYPTFFKFKGMDYKQTLLRDCHINLRSRIMFETDALNDYFSRNIDKGSFSLSLFRENALIDVDNYVGPNLQNGIATLSIKHPENYQVGDKLHFVSKVTDPSQVDPFENHFKVHIKEESKSTGKRGKRRKPPSDEEGDDREIPTGISLPNIVLIKEEDYNDHTPAFDKYTALRIRNAGTTEDNGESENQEIYDFMVNMDNIYLKTELKASNYDTEIAGARFKYGLVLLGLGLLQNYIQSRKAKNDNNNDGNDHDSEGTNIEDKVEEFTKAVAPVLLPIIDFLGGELDT